MPIACTRCGAKEEGEIITAPIAFTFKHETGCGHGVGPLAVIKGQIKKSKIEKDPDVIITDKDEIRVEGKVEEKPKKSVKEKIKVFGKREKSDG